MTFTASAKSSTSIFYLIYSDAKFKIKNKIGRELRGRFEVDCIPECLVIDLYDHYYSQVTSSSTSTSSS